MEHAAIAYRLEGEERESPVKEKPCRYEGKEREYVVKEKPCRSEGKERECSVKEQPCRFEGEERECFVKEKPWRYEGEERDSSVKEKPRRHEGEEEECSALLQEVASETNSSSSSEDSTLKAPSTQSGSGPETVIAANSNGVHLNVATPEELKAFLKEIHKGFLANVHPEESGLMDRLEEESLLSAIDKESLNGKHVHTRRDQARKLWLLLNKVSLEDFKAKVFPPLYDQYHHIVPHSFCSARASKARAASGGPSRLCVRHDLMMRARPTTIADLLFECGCIDIDEYSEMTSDICKLSDAEMWRRLFSAFRGHDDPTAKRLEEEVRVVLGGYKLPLPTHLGVLLSRGVPCTCHLHPEDLPPGAPSIQGSSTDGRDTEDQNHFQCNTSQYLGSDDTDFSLAAILDTLDPDFRMWAVEQGLSDLSLRMLVREEIKSKEDLLRLTPERLETYLPLLPLPVQQLSLLEELVKKLQTEPNPKSVPGLSTVLTGLEDAIRILLVGKTGSGKSSSGNTILGLKEWERFHHSLSMTSHTKDCQFEASDDGTVQVLDCPGLFDTDLSLEAVCTRIVKAVIAMVPGPSVVLYVLKIGDKYTDEEFGTYQRLKAIFGDDVTRHMMVLFTRGDELRKNGKTIQDYVRTSTPRFKQVLNECGGRYVVFDNTPTGLNREQIERLQQKIQEMLQDSGSPYYRPPHFSQQQDKILREVRRLLKTFNKAEFEMKKRLIDGEEKEPFYKKLWQEVWEILEKILRLFRHGGSG